jgi:sec-independent protein translocase protein TatA
MYDTLIPLFPGGIPGGTELVVILLIAVLLFGANKIPKLARSTGQAMGEFQKGREQVEQELEELQEGATLDDEGNVVDEDGNVIEGADASDLESSGSDASSTSTSTSTSTESTTSE